jgi:hypothetical protein
MLEENDSWLKGCLSHGIWPFLSALLPERMISRFTQRGVGFRWSKLGQRKHEETNHFFHNYLFALSLGVDFSAERPPRQIR